MSELTQKKCKPCEGGVPPLTAAEAERLLKHLPGWRIHNGVLTRTFRFDHYDATMAFVNATAWISRREDHHPDLAVGYNQCQVNYITHAIGGLSENDFICAAKIDALFQL